MTAQTEKLWAGLDWGDSVHTLCIVAEGGRPLRCLSAAQDAQGIAKIVAALHEVSNLAGVAIETPRHLLVDALCGAGLTVYPVNPKLAHRWRECLSVNAVKDDERDAWTLAHGLSLYQPQLRPLSIDEPQMRALTLLCEQEQLLIGKRTALVCELEAVLKQYFPCLLGWFEDWAVPNPWNFVLAFSTPQALADATKQKLCGWFKKQHMRLTPERLERIEARRDVLELAAEDALGQIHAMRAVTLASELNAIEKGIREHRARIEALYAEQPQAELFSSLPGAGPKLAPRLMCIFFNCQERYTSAKGVCELSGTAPVTKQSGRTTHVHFRRACKKSYRNSMHHYAWVSMRYCAWAKAFYKQCRKTGQGHAQALRNLAIKWTKIIYRMCCENTCYDERRYLDALRNTNSPLILHMTTNVDNPVDNSTETLDFAT